MAAYVTNLPLNNVFNVTATFGQTGGLWKNGHKGIDLTGDKKIYSVCDGEVTFEGYDADGWGRYVSIMPTGQSRVRFIFCHLENNSVKVKKGDKVTRLTHIATMGSTGNSTGVHLHIEMRIDNTPCDVSPYLLIPNKKAITIINKVLLLVVFTIVSSSGIEEIVSDDVILLLSITSLFLDGKTSKV